MADLTGRTVQQRPIDVIGSYAVSATSGTIATVPATGTWQAQVIVEWSEVSAF